MTNFDMMNPTENSRTFIRETAFTAPSKAAENVGVFGLGDFSWVDAMYADTEIYIQCRGK